MKKSLLLTTSLTSCALLIGVIHPVHANPEGGVVAAGVAEIITGAKQVDINQSSNRAVIDWRSFNIGADEVTNFHQPSSSSMTVNRVNDANPSVILGRLHANGNVAIINQSGVLFGQGSVVDVNGLVATTADISNADAMAGNYNFNSAGHANAQVINRGTITAGEAGLVGLVAPHVENSGVITARLGKVHLASGDKFTLDMYGDGLVNIAASDAVERQIISNSGTINVEGGTIQMTAADGANAISSLVDVQGELKATSISQDGGRIIISGGENGSVSITGAVDASGVNGGSVSLSGRSFLVHGTVSADAISGGGGQVAIAYKSNYQATQNSHITAKGKSGRGGRISVVGASGANSLDSGNYDVSSESNKGGDVSLSNDGGTLKVFGAHINADGATGGGNVLIGGDYQGSGTLVHAATTGVNYSTYISASAIQSGNGGKVVVWSDDDTKFAGHVAATGGVQSGNGGLVELSSHNNLVVVPNADIDAAAHNTTGHAGSLLLDPKNITIATGGISGGISYFEFVDPNPDSGYFGNSVYVLANGNVVVFDTGDDFGATDAGAVYLFNGATGALISNLYGTSANDQIGVNYNLSSFVTDLNNNSFIITSPNWDNGAATEAGAVTWINGTTGLSGAISSANSLVGTTTNDFIGNFLVLLGNGNAVAYTTAWDDGAIADVGAVSFIDGAVGQTGNVSSANSLVGTTANDYVGNYVNVLTNHNYVVSSYDWDNGAIVDAGAATWGDGSVGITGAVTAANSLVGGTNNDAISRGAGVTALTNGNYVVSSSQWSNGGNANAGAVTWGNGLGGTVGVVDSSNSLVGSSADDRVGESYILALANGNYVVSGWRWDNGAATDAGFAAWGNGATGISGVINATNALVGTTTNDRISNDGLVALTNGNYVVKSVNWNNGAVAFTGAVTWGNGLGGTVGAVDATNSLVGDTTWDMSIIGVYALANGNYVVLNQFWDNGAIVDAGAATWGDGTIGVSGSISTTNSLYGTTANDFVGGNIAELSNGNYVIISRSWNNGAATQAGAVTWANGTTGLVGAVSTVNSIYGTSTLDVVGIGGVIALSNGNYVVGSPYWDNGAVSDAGAVTWGNGAVGTVGAVSAANSLVGASVNDKIGEENYIRTLNNGNYIVVAPNWDNGAISDAGAVVWGNGAIGTFGSVSTLNSLYGTSAGDHIGGDDGLVSGGFVRALSNGNYIIGSHLWDNGATADAGAITWGDGATGTVGAVTIANSLVGSTANDYIGRAGGDLTSDGLYVIYNYLWDNGAIADGGAISILSGTGPTTGIIDVSNSFLGSSAFSMNYVLDGVNHRVIVSDSYLQKVYSSVLGGGSLSSYDSYADFASASITLDPMFITNVLDAGTDVTLQANNDITLTDALIVNNGAGNGGHLTLQAGRSIFINNNIDTDNGNLSILANENLATGVVDGFRDAGNAVITMGVGASIDTGSGDVYIRLNNGVGKTNYAAGSISLRTIAANTLTVINNNSTGDIVINPGSILWATDTSGTSLLLSSGRNFINNAGGGAFTIDSGARWLTYSTNPTADTVGGLVADFTLFNCTNGGACGALGAGNGFLYSSSSSSSSGSTSDFVLPPTYLFVSQTPPENIVMTTNGFDNQGVLVNHSQEMIVQEDHSSSANFQQAKDKKEQYYLIDGWIKIHPQLVRMYDLLRAVI